MTSDSKQSTVAEISPVPSHAAAVAGRHRVRPILRPGVPTPHAAPRAFAAEPRPALVPEQYNGTPTDVMLQGFHWTSRNSRSPNWYQILAANAPVIQDAGFNLVWFPPPSQSAYNAEGYMPTRWNVLDTAYGGRADLIKALAALKPLRVIADIVVNHRCGVATAGVDFEAPTFPDPRAAVCKDDECGIGTGNLDTGENQIAARDLDHTNSDVQNAVIDYLNGLKTLGFSGWRYDEARGYAGYYVGQYNDATRPYLSVGEYWDSDRQNVVDWIDATRDKSMAFDFPTRMLLKSAIDQRQFSLLKTIDGKPTGAIGFWPSMCVTFIEDHDTAKDHPYPDEFGNGDQVLQGYAYLLTHPGIPCVFWVHYFDYGKNISDKIKALIAIRKTQGLNSRSVVNIAAADDGKYAAIIDNKVAMKLGPAPWDPGSGWTVAVDGNDFAVWTRDL